MKRERQVEESKELIVDGFLNLLRKKAFEAITLSEIADEAKVSRMTLHRHFKQKEQIILYRVEKIIGSLDQQSSARNSESLEQRLLHRFTVLKKLPHAKLLVYNQKISSLLYDLRFMNTNQVVENHVPNFTDQYLLHFFMGGVDTMVKEWIKNDFDETPEEMAKKTLMMVRAMGDYTADTGS